MLPAMPAIAATLAIEMASLKSLTFPLCLVAIPCSPSRVGSLPSLSENSLKRGITKVSAHAGACERPGRADPTGPELCPMRYQRPMIFHQMLPAPSQTTRLIKLVTKPHFHQVPWSMYPAPK